MLNLIDNTVFDSAIGGDQDGPLGIDWEYELGQSVLPWTSVSIHKRKRFLAFRFQLAQLLFFLLDKCFHRGLAEITK